MRRLRGSRVRRTSPLPAVGGLVNEPAYADLVGEFGHERVVEAIRHQVDAERRGEEASGEERVMLVKAALGVAVAPIPPRLINPPRLVLPTHLRPPPLLPSPVDALARAP